jgi:exoribonuclease R
VARPLSQQPALSIATPDANFNKKKVPDIASPHLTSHHITSHRITLPGCSEGDAGILKHLAYARAASSAEYIVVGSQPYWKEWSEWSHASLAMPYYTHFTSPMRRYADVMVHRILLKMIDDQHRHRHSRHRHHHHHQQEPTVVKRSGNTGGQSADDTTDTSFSTTSMRCDDGGGDSASSMHDLNVLDRDTKHCNDMKFRADGAQRKCTHVYLAAYLATHPRMSDALVVSLVRE